MFVSAVFLSFKADKKIIVIDAGHGGDDHGATYNQISEKDVVQDIAKKIKAWSENKNVEIILTREDDLNVQLSERVKKIGSAKPDLVISLHTNSYPNNNKAGTEIFIQENDASKSYGTRLAEMFNNCPVNPKNLYILKNSEVPVIMLEIGNIRNENEFNYMNSENGKSEISRKILKFINEI